MAAIIGLEFGAVVKIADSGGERPLPQRRDLPCGDRQRRRSGRRLRHGAAVERAMELAKLAGAKRALLLPVSAPFHCALMKPAALAMEKALKDVKILPPKPPLVANVDATAVADPETIRSGLVAQMTGTVRWRESVAYMSAHGVMRFIEVGTGKVLDRPHQANCGKRDGDQHRHARRHCRLHSLGGALSNPAERTKPLFDLTGRTALVTGASGGLGGAIARALHAQGAAVALSGTSRDALETLAAELEHRAHPTPCDLPDAAAPKRWFRPPRPRSERSTFWSITPA